MELIPHDWSVVVVGFWNRAIYTPKGIADRLFQVSGEGTEVRIEIPFDTVGPFRVGLGDHIVIVDGGRLSVEAESHTLDCLAEAMIIAVRAIEDLPKTPLMAAGINIRFRTQKDAEKGIPAVVLDSVQHSWDDSLQAAGFDVSHKSVTRKFNWQGGNTLLTVIEEEGGQLDVHLNFEKVSDDAQELINWLQKPTDNIRSHVNRIHREILDLEPPLK